MSSIAQLEKEVIGLSKPSVRGMVHVMSRLS